MAKFWQNWLSGRKQWEKWRRQRGKREQMDWSWVLRLVQWLIIMMTSVGGLAALMEISMLCVDMTLGDELNWQIVYQLLAVVMGMFGVCVLPISSCSYLWWSVVRCAAVLKSSRKLRQWARERALEDIDTGTLMDVVECPRLFSKTDFIIWTYAAFSFWAFGAFVVFRCGPFADIVEFFYAIRLVFCGPVIAISTLMIILLLMADCVVGVLIMRLDWELMHIMDKMLNES